MSSHKHLYLGPYVECTYKPETRIDNVVGCTNTECKRHPKKVGPDADGKFCSTCGNPNGKIPITVKARTDRYDVVGDELFTLNPEDPKTNTLLLAPNVRRKGDPRENFDDDGEVHLDLLKVKPEAEIAWFRDAFARELKKLEAAYATVTVKWGLHQYFM